MGVGSAEGVGAAKGTDVKKVSLSANMSPGSQVGLCRGFNDVDNRAIMPDSMIHR